jgi:hypothetical protein
MHGGNINPKLLFCGFFSKSLKAEHASFAKLHPELENLNMGFLEFIENFWGFEFCILKKIEVNIT